MTKRGRKSAAALEAVSSVVEVMERPRPPAGISKNEKAIWERVTGSFAADYFPASTFDVLLSYCRHTVSAQRIWTLIEQENRNRQIDLDTLDRLYKMYERETRALSSDATRLKITNQATKNHRGNSKAKTITAPWEDAG